MGITGLLLYLDEVQLYRTQIYQIITTDYAN
jgi:hypothetical protein